MSGCYRSGVSAERGSPVCTQQYTQYIYLLCMHYILILTIFRREALEQWKQKSGLNATYRNLVDVFKAAGHQEYVETVYKLFC